jgi:cysteine-rich repeat protein
MFSKLVNKKTLALGCIIGVFALFAVGVLPTEVFAQADTFGLNQVDDTVTLGSDDIRVTIAKIIRAVLGLLGAVAVGIILYGGFVYMTAGGSEEKVAQAKQIITNGIIGLAIILSSFAITQFVLSRLSDATGSGSVPCLEGDCDDKKKTKIVILDGKDSCSAKKDLFIVESISPNQDKTGVNNIIIRAFFSKAVKTQPNDVFNIRQDGNLMNKDQFHYAYVPGSGQRGVMAFFKQGSCIDGNGKCLPEGKSYNVKVKKGVVGLDDLELQNEDLLDDCPDSGYPELLKNGVGFNVDKKENDKKKPNVSVKLLDASGKSVATLGQKDAKFEAGEAYTVVTTVSDDHGVGYLNTKIGEVNGEKLLDEWDAPAQSDKGFSAAYVFTVSNSTKPGTKFSIDLEASDIDSQKVETSLELTVADNGGEEGSYCSQTSDCKVGLSCEANVCTKKPYLTTIDPDNGAPGNWITVAGLNFGTYVAGQSKIEFGYDQNGDKKIDNNEWILAPLAKCNAGNHMWTDEYAVVEVPDDKNMKTAAVRVISSYGKLDASNDDFGPKAGPFGSAKATGLFTVNNTKRPGLCNVTHADNHTHQAVQSEKVIANGAGFGTETGSVNFGGFSPSITSWNNKTVNTEVPKNMAAGSVGVKIKNKAGEESNGVLFTVLPDDSELAVPSISDVDPSNPRAESYVTIFGNSFGKNVGKVFLAEKPDDLCKSNCLEVKTPAVCGNTWADGQVVIELPKKNLTPVGKQYYFVVENNTTLERGIAKDPITIAAGGSAPGLCSIQPSKGPSPLPVGGKLTLQGNNLDSAIVYFYKQGEDLAKVNKWFSSAKYKVLDKQNSTETKIITSLPIEKGASMSTGPIKVSVGGQLSNSVYYEVQDCSVDPSGKPGKGYHCCSLDGPDKGLWKKDEFACTGEVRDAGYVWRFTTGDFPNIPEVIEETECQPLADIKAKKLPSPSPWVEQLGGTNACTNALVSLRFTTNMDTKTLTKDTVKLYECAGGNAADCSGENKKLSVLEKVEAEGKTLIASPLILKPTTWYRVELSSKVQSHNVVKIAGNEEVQKQLLKATRPCGDGTAYCYTFKTASESCEISGASITPSEYTTQLVGVIQSPSYLVDNNVDNPKHPLNFVVWGTTKNSCVPIKVEGLGWDWQPKTKISPFITAVQITPDTKANVRALKHNDNGVILSATLKKNESNGIPKDIVAESSITVDLLEPEVTFNEPSCLQSCINPQIVATFNRHMDIKTYNSGFTLYDCGKDATCGAKKVFGAAEADTNLSNKTSLHVNLKQPLSVSTYYMVSLDKKIKSYSGSGLYIGRPLTPKTWTFKTSDDPTPCTVSYMTIAPHPFTSTQVGEKTIYSVTPYSASNKCSAQGQALDKWDFEYSWSVANKDVASVTAFKHTPADKLNQSCTTSCLPTGSDISRNALVIEKAACGNGRVDPGEDCDIAIAGEAFGTSCTFECLRPGNDNKSKPQSCGNGKVDGNLGEACDPGGSLKEPKTDDPACTATCTLRGSTKFDGTAKSNCGDGGEPGPGEACDPGSDKKDNIVANHPSCTSSCLNRGTQLAASWCEDQTNPPAECGAAVSICGNLGANPKGLSRLENEEECEIVYDTNQYGLQIKGIQGLFFKGASPDNAAQYCTPSCKLKNVCELRSKGPVNLQQDVGGWFCNPGEEGCNSECRIAGSSGSYSVPSMCGDAVKGIGEFAGCELKANVVSNGSGPAQIVTSVGKDKNAKDGIQKTVITASIVSNNKAIAKGEYTLQCGFTEFESPEPGKAFNDCPNSADGASSLNACCYARPKRDQKTTYPEDGEGLGGKAGVCRNTAIEVVYDKEIDEGSVIENAILVRGYTDIKHVCAASNREKEATAIAKDLLAYNVDSQPTGIWNNFVQKIKNIFAAAFGDELHASNFAQVVQDKEKIVKWCEVTQALDSSVLNATDKDGKVTASTINLALDTVLEKDTVYGVILKSGPDGIQDVDGVSIAHLDSQWVRDEMWVFKTGVDICKIERVVVEPKNQLFTKPDQAKDFKVMAYGKKNAKLVATPAYDWVWEWQPEKNPVFAIVAKGAVVQKQAPKAGSNVPNGEQKNSKEPVQSIESATISSKNVQGTISLSATAIVTKDVSIAGNQEGKNFTAFSELTAQFCENPWPSFKKDGTWEPFADEKFNFSFRYCADAGKSSSLADDLPYLKEVVPGGNTCSIDTKSCKVDSDCGPGYPWPSTYKLDPTRAYEKFVGLGDDEAICFFVKSPTPTIKPGCQSHSECPADYPICHWYNNSANSFENEGCVAYQFPDEPTGTTTGKDACPSDFDRPGYYRKAVTQLTFSGSKLALSQTCEEGNFSKKLAGLAGPEKVVHKKGQCSLKGTWDKPKSCSSNADCEAHSLRIFNLPGDTNFPNDGDLVDKDAICAPSNFVNAEAVKNNSCTVYEIPLGKGICRARKINGATTSNGKNIEHILFPPEYSKQDTYAICQSDSYCQSEFAEGPKDEWFCDTGFGKSVATPFMILGNTCVGADVEELLDNTYITQPIQRSFFVDETGKNDDVIGLQVFNNNGDNKGENKRLTAVEWYTKRFPNAQPPQPITIAGYDGVSDGSNYYVNAMNVVKNPAGSVTVYSNIYVMSINPDAEASTRQVFTELLNSLEYNTNITDHGYCVKDSIKKEDVDFVAEITKGSSYPYTSQSCSTDFDCLDQAGAPLDGTNGVCSNARTKFLRDWSRLGHVKSAQAKIESFVQKPNNQTYPQLKSGSFIPGYSVSKWSSWGALSNLVKDDGGVGLDSDPINEWSQCAGADQQTCWNSDSTSFLCPNNSSVYEYVFNTSTPDGKPSITGSYALHVPMEYFKDKNIVSQEFGKEFSIDTSKLEVGQFCEPSASYSPFGSGCGDGIVQPGEQCDPPGKTVLGTINECKWLQAGYSCVGTCTSECKISYELQKSGNCGNGVIDGSEKCDDGALNGTYGHCAGSSSKGTIVEAACVANAQFFVAKDQSRIFLHRVPEGEYNALKTPFGKLASESPVSYAANSAIPACGNKGLTGQTVCKVAKAGGCVSTQYATNIGDPTFATKDLGCTNNLDADLGSPKKKDGVSSVLVRCSGEYKKPFTQGFVGSCQGPHEDYCGNGLLDKGNEFCDSTANEWDYYAQDKAKSCGLSCQGPGLYCGDGLKTNGEQCDDGNNNNKDGCSSTCKSENTACIKALPQYQNRMYDGNVTSTSMLITRISDKDYNKLLVANFPTPSPGTEHIESCFTSDGHSICSAATGEKCLRIIKEDKDGYSGNMSCDSQIDKKFDPSVKKASEERVIVQCKGTYKGELLNQQKATSTGCGNLEVESGEPNFEACDEGNKNGIACTPEYGKSCTYCASDCKKVLTIDTVNFCGNGKVELKDGELCDYEGSSSDPSKIFEVSKGGKVSEISCDDKGVYKCLNQCKTVSNQCVTCGHVKDSAKARVSFINPMVSNFDGTANYSSGNKPVVTLFRNKDDSKGKTLLATFSFKKEKNLMSFNEMDISNKSNFGIETDLACSDVYDIVFNMSKLSDNKGIQTGVIDAGRGDAFDFPVANQQVFIENQYIYSPAVPKMNYRVVVKWKKTKASKEMFFAGGLYSEGVQGNNKFLNAADTKACTDISLSKEGYWLPAAECNKDKLGFNAYTHPIIEARNHYIQSFTIDGSSIKAGKPVAFFVKSLLDTTKDGKLSSDDAVGPIGLYTNLDITVDVYNYHAEQNPTYSVYKPVKTFKIGTAASKSGNIGVNKFAKFWYVFNILRVVPSDDSKKVIDLTNIDEVETIETNIDFFTKEYKYQK